MEHQNKLVLPESGIEKIRHLLHVIYELESKFQQEQDITLLPKPSTPSTNQEYPETVKIKCYISHIQWNDNISHPKTLTSKK